MTELSIAGLTKTLGSRQVLRRIDLTVEFGGIGRDPRRFGQRQDDAAQMRLRVRKAG